MASPRTHLEEFANVTSRELWCKHMEQQTDVLPVKVMDKSMCQGVGNGLRTSLTKRNRQVNHVRWYNKTGQVHAAEQFVSGDQCVQMEREPQELHASVPEPSAQPSSSSYEEPVQVSTTPRRARNPDDENEMRTVRPRLDMSTLINELWCERDVLEN